MQVFRPSVNCWHPAEKKESVIFQGRFSLLDVSFFLGYLAQGVD